GDAADDQRVSGGEEAGRPFGGIDQVDRGRAQDFLSIPRRQRRDRTRSDRSAQSAADRALFARNVERDAGRTVTEWHRHEGVTRLARPGDDRAALREWAAHFRTGQFAAGEFFSGRKNDSRDWQGKQNADRAGRPQSV